jgi:hypothetical protein
LSGTPRQLIYYGWLGNNNLGDEALYMAISHIFSSFPFRFSSVPADAYYGEDKEYSPVTIIGGSTGIPDWMECFRSTHYNYIFGAGVRDPSLFYTYLLQDPRASVWINRLKVFRYIGVRGEISKNVLAKWGITSEVIGDPSFSLRPSHLKAKEDDTICINLGSDGILWGMNDSLVFHEITKVIRKLKQEEYNIILIPFRNNNILSLSKLAKDEGVGFFDNWFNIQSTVDLIASSKLLIGERVHSLGLSAAAGTPFVSIEYQPPCFEIAQSLGFQDYSVRTDVLTEEKVIRLFHNLIENYDEMLGKLNEKVEIYRERQAKFAAQIVRDIDSLPQRYWRSSKIGRSTQKWFWRADEVSHKSPSVWRIWDRLFFSHVMQYPPW